MPKKKVEKNTEENTEVTETSTENTINPNMKDNDTINEEMQKPKVKKPRTDKQIAAFAKAQEAIKAKRAKAKEDKEKGITKVEDKLEEIKQQREEILEKEPRHYSVNGGEAPLEVEYVKKPKRKAKKKKIVIEQDSSSSDEEIVISRRRGRKKKVDTPAVDISTPLEVEKEIVEDLKPPEVQYTHKQMLQAFGL
tara:strand:+ start:59 stop:640 length:582 start_codon:yes stop_codon:yes gene_type:complete